MTKEELLKQLKKEKESTVAKFTTIGTYAHGMGYVDGLKKAIDLTEKLDEPKKVVIPELIANDIKYHKKHGSTLRGALGSAFDSDDESNVYCWFFAADGDENVRKYISAWDNGYEVENKIEKYVRLKGFEGTTGYLNYDFTFEKFFVDTKELDGCTKIKFTKSWLKNHWSEYDAYNDAGLLEFEEVEDE